MTIHSFAHDVPGPYLRASFEPKDRLAIVLVNKRPDSVIQRIATADKIASQDFQAWLRYQNSQRYEIYVSMNALREDARGRTKRVRYWSMNPQKGELAFRHEVDDARWVSLEEAENLLTYARDSVLVTAVGEAARGE